LPREAFAALQKSQRQWIAYRKQEYNFISQYYFRVKEGTMWHVVAEGEKTAIVKERALKLIDYLEELDY